MYTKDLVQAAKEALILIPTLSTTFATLPRRENLASTLMRATQSDMKPDFYPKVHPAIIENGAMALISLRDSFVIPATSYEWG